MNAAADTNTNPGCVERRTPRLFTMIGTLQTWQWAASDDAAPLLEAVSGEPSISQLTRLRERWSPEQIAVATELVQARAKARAKFPERSGSIVADRTGLEMASSSRAARHKAKRFREHISEDTSIIDACCGIGGDAMGLTNAGLDVTAIDLDDRRVWMAGKNASCEYRTADVTRVETRDTAIHIDPARRSASGRTRSLDEFDPPIADIERLVAAAPMAAIKLNPGVRAELLPPGELEVISESGTLTQAVLWTGAIAEHERRATRLTPDGDTISIAGTPDRAMDVNEVCEFVYTMDPSLERADLVPAFLESAPLRLVHPGTGLLTSDSFTDSPWTAGFRVHTECSWSKHNVKHALRDLDAGIVTVKTRAGVVDPDKLSRQLRGSGSREATVFVLRFGQHIRALVTERVASGHNKTPPDVHGSSGRAWMEET